MAYGFSYKGRKLEIHAIPTVGGFRLEISENGRRVDDGGITADQAEMNEDSDLVMKWVVDEVAKGGIPLKL